MITKRSKKPKTTLYVRNVPRNLMRRFKARCAVAGITITDGIINLIQKEVDGHNRSPE